jgi:hypothetical protein
MLVSGVLFVLFDIAATVFLVSAIVRLAASRRSRHARTWPAARRPARARDLPALTYGDWHPDWVSAESSFARHPAGRSRQTPADGCALPKGPDDDPEFLRALEQRIREMRGENTD